jgi:hypothetical protein
MGLTADSFIEDQLMAHGHTRSIFDANVEWGLPARKLLALVMAFSADRRGIIRLTQSELASETLLSRQRVSDLIDDLCGLGVIARLGHGRYGLRYGLPKDGVEHRQVDDLPIPKGSVEEKVRLESILAAEMESGNRVHAIRWSPDGWPALEVVPEDARWW